jgi:hypothetical protein
MRLRVLELPYPIPADGTPAEIPFVFVIDRVGYNEATAIRDGLSVEIREMTGARAALVLAAEVDIPAAD